MARYIDSHQTGENQMNALRETLWDVASNPDELPRSISAVKTPPIKCQGIKTKLVPFILANVSWTSPGRWVEPFVGSGVVLFNLRPQRALASDTNEHVIRLYKEIQDGTIDSASVRHHLEREGGRLASRGADHYYLVRARFNEAPNSLDFLFLNRSCFNGLIRFNRQGDFNVPFGHKPDRFRPAYVTKIANQVDFVCQAMAGRDWEFVVADWHDTIERLRAGDFVYADPPYSGRFSDYYSRWEDDSLRELISVLLKSPAGFAVSTWKENRYRRNIHVDFGERGLVVRTIQHFYHLGATEALRNSMEEALMVRSGFEAMLESAPSIDAHQPTA